MSSNVYYEPGERLLLTLKRPESSVPWGFRLQGGVDFNIPLSIQTVQERSVAEKCGLQSGDGIERINNRSCDALTHEDAKKEIIRSGNDIVFSIIRGALRIWKPQVTPADDVQPRQQIKSAIGDDIVPVQKTSLAANRSQQQDVHHIGSSHNRAARPFGAKQATPNVVHTQFNSPIGLYSADNIAETYATQTQGLSDQVQRLDLSGRDVGMKMSGTYQALDSPTGDRSEHANPTPSTLTNESSKSDNWSDCKSTIDLTDNLSSNNSRKQSRSFYKIQSDIDSMNASSTKGPSGYRPVQAPEPMKGGPANPQPPPSRCYGCNMLITGVFVRASGQPYHVQCLKCTTCGMNLKQKGFIVVNDKLYCDIHAKRAAVPPGPGLVAVPTFQ